MPTTKTRLNITLLPEVEAAIKRLAERDRISRAGKASQLLLVALEIEEDRVWDELAKKRDVRGAKFVSHKKAWA
ncbi:MAG: hypothetical protein Q7K28_01600 [Candidatus Wildermuthbacteria bacterium]|nr:hypothetical protein [Candidatus Wildermuthbacteria bacterium]